MSTYSKTTWATGDTITASLLNNLETQYDSVMTGGAMTGPLSITVGSATAFTVANTGTNYGLQVDTSASGAATGLKITSAAAASGLALSVISSGTNESLTIAAKGSGTVTVNSNVSLTGTATMGGAVSITSGGLAVSSGGVSITGGFALSIGNTTAASTGTIRLANNSTIYSRNAANSGDILLMTLDSGNAMTIGQSTAILGMSFRVGVGNDFTFYTSGTNTATISSGGVVTAAGGLVATTGGLTVSAGGITATGNSTITGTLGVTGNLTIGADAGSSIQVKINGAAASSTTVALQSAGTDVWYIQRPGSTSDFRIYNNTASAAALTIANATNNATFGAALSTSGALTVTSTGSAAVAVGANGATNPVWQVDASTASVATGLKVTGAAAASGVALAVISSGTNENLTINAKGSGTITLNGTGTGGITLGRATTITTGGLTVSAGGAAITGDATVSTGHLSLLTPASSNLQFQTAAGTFTDGWYINANGSGNNLQVVRKVSSVDTTVLTLNRSTSAATFGGAVTISTGGLTVTAGGIAVTAGNVAVNGASGAVGAFDSGNSSAVEMSASSGGAINWRNASAGVNNGTGLWTIYNAVSTTLYIRDQQNGRMQVQFDPGSSSSVALTTFNSKVTTGGALTVSAGGLTVTAGGATITAGNLGIGTAANTSRGIWVSNSLSLTGSINQTGVFSNPTFDSGATNVGAGVYAKIQTAASSFTMSNGYPIHVDTPTIGSGSAVTNIRGVYVANQGASGVTNAYGMYIEAQSGAATTNVGLYNLGTSRFAGVVGIGVAPDPATVLRIASTVLTTGSTQWGIIVNPPFGSDATTAGRAIHAQVVTNAASFTMTDATGLYIDNPSKGSGSSITNAYGVLVKAQTAGSTSNYGVYIEAPSGGATANVGLYNAGTTTLAGATTITTGDLTVSSGGFSVGGSRFSTYYADFQGSVTVSGGSARGLVWRGTLTTAANNDVTHGIVSAGTLDTGTYTGLNHRGLRVVPVTKSGTGTIASLYAVYVDASSTVATSSYGQYVGAITGGTTNNYGLYLEAPSGGATTNIGLYNAGSSQLVGNVGFYGTSPQTKQTVTGSRGGNAALASLLTALSTLGLITDSSSA